MTLREDLIRNDRLGSFSHDVPLLSSCAFLLDDVLDEAVACCAGDGHVSILLELCVVALSFLRNTVSEEPSRIANVLILHREHLVEAAQVVQLVNPSIFDLQSKLFPSHLVPKEGALLVHFLQFSVTHDPVKVLLSISLIDSQNLEGVPYDCLLHLVVESAVCLEAGRLVHLKKPRLRVGVNQDVKAEYFEAHVKGSIIWLARAVVV